MSPGPKRLIVGAVLTAAFAGGLYLLICGAYALGLFAWLP